MQLLSVSPVAQWDIMILQGSAVTQTVLGVLTIHFWLQISYSVYVPKIMEIGWQ